MSCRSRPAWRRATRQGFPVRLFHELLARHMANAFACLVDPGRWAREACHPPGGSRLGSSWKDAEVMAAHRNPPIAILPAALITGCRQVVEHLNPGPSRSHAVRDSQVASASHRPSRAGRACASVPAFPGHQWPRDTSPPPGVSTLRDQPHSRRSVGSALSQPTRWRIVGRSRMSPGDEVRAAAHIDPQVHQRHIVNIRGNSFQVRDHQNLLQAGLDRHCKRAAF